MLRTLVINFIKEIKGILIKLFSRIPLEYHIIPNISPALIELRKHFWGGLLSWGLYSGGLIFGGHFSLVSEYENFEIYRYIYCDYR